MNNSGSPLIVTLSQSEYDIASCEQLARELEPTYTHPQVVVDMSAVRYIDSTCLGKLVRMRSERGRRSYPPAHLVVLSTQIRRLFEIVRFDHVWPLYDSLEAALGELTAPAEEADKATG